MRLAVTCYYIASLIQEWYLWLPAETEARLHRLCPSVSAHLVNGDNRTLDGAVETLLNHVEGSYPTTAEEEAYEAMVLRSIDVPTL